MLSMMSHLPRCFLLVIFLTSSAAVLGNAADSALGCGNDKSCAAVAKLTALVNEMSKKLDTLAANMNDMRGTQAKDLEVLKKDVNLTLASTVSISTQLGRHSSDLLSHDGRLRAHDVSQRTEHQLVQNIYGAELGPRDCSDIRERGYNVSGVYRVYPGSDHKRREADVYCDFQNVGQSWLVFQRRKDGSVNFDRLWKDYANGFGDLTGEFWLGNEKLSLLTMNRRYKLRIELEDFTGHKRFAEYSKFSIRPVTDKYRLTVAGYTGNAGDSLTDHSGFGFTTKDVDNDAHTNNCAQMYRGAWWYDKCHPSNLNGFYLGGSHTSYAEGIVWNTWHGYYYSLRATAMKIMAVY